MRVIAQISDLHFGCEDPAVVAGLVRDLNGLRPDLVAVSGDLTQRARKREFSAAAALLADIRAPKVVVPGNHDIPLHPARRFFSPRKYYRRYIAEETNPVHRDEELVVLGLDTARLLAARNGRISEAQLERVRAVFRGAGAEIRAIVLHHPPIIPARDASRSRVGRAAPALDAFREVGVDLVFSGHLHRAHVGDHRGQVGGEDWVSRASGMLFIQAGTATSQRHRGEPNAYNLVTVDGQRASVSVRVWNGAEFAEHVRFVYLLPSRSPRS